jgi:hypothetical protein
MDALAPLLAALAGLIALAGLAKLRSPLPAAFALDSIGVPVGERGVRVVGACELALGVLVLADPSPLSAALLALAYGVFALVIARLAGANSGAVPCGCFGEGSFTATRTHAWFDLGAAAIAAAAAPAPPPGPADWFGDPLQGIAACAAVACSVWLAYVAFTLLPATWGAPAR